MTSVCQSSFLSFLLLLLGRGEETMEEKEEEESLGEKDLTMGGWLNGHD